MKSGIPRIFDAVRSGEFSFALNECKRLLREDPEDFWLTYLAAVSAAFLDERTEFRPLLDRARELGPDSPYCRYLQAYADLWDNDLEKALFHWTELINQKEGWLARELLEKARRHEDISEAARQGRVADFIILPDFIREIAPPGNNTGEATPETGLWESPEEKLSSGFFSGFLSLLKSLPGKLFRGTLPRTAVIISIPVILIGLTFLFLKILPQQRGRAFPWENLTIMETAGILPDQKDIAFRYDNRRDLVEDFQEAKTLLKQGKINRCRYLLNRIILSNADFQSREKSRLFLNFIPDPDYRDFRDPVPVSRAVSEPRLHQGVLVLWEGELLRTREVEKGKEVRLLIRDGEKDFIVEGFVPDPGGVKKISWLPLSSFERDSVTERKTAIVYGNFKGLIGDQKVPYLEIRSIWR